MLAFEHSCDTVLGAILSKLGQSEQRLEQDFQGKVGGLDVEIPKQAMLAASKEQPAWKGVLAVVLIIAIIIVVALVIGPAVIGAVGAAAAALGASAGVATAVGALVGGAIVGALSSGAITLVQNWASGQRLTAGLGRAMLIGAATGFVGGAIGLGVNAGLNAVLSGGRAALSAGAQFAVRAAVNVTSDSLLNIGQQMALSGHVDWGEFAQGLALSLVLHGSRRVQGFQARVTAVGARGAASGISRFGGTAEPTVAASRASRFAGQMEQHAITASDEARKPLDSDASASKAADCCGARRSRNAHCHGAGAGCRFPTCRGRRTVNARGIAAGDGSARSSRAGRGVASGRGRCAPRDGGHTRSCRPGRDGNHTRSRRSGRDGGDARTRRAAHRGRAAIIRRRSRGGRSRRAARGGNRADGDSCRWPGTGGSHPRRSG